MAYTPEQLEEFLAYRDAEAEKLGDATLPANPNAPIRNYLSFLERKYAVYDWEESEVRTRAEALFNEEDMADINRVVETIDWENRVTPYNRPPIEWDAYLASSGDKYAGQYVENLRQWEERKEQWDSTMMAAQVHGITEVGVPPPIGLEKAKRLTALGWDPDNEIEISPGLRWKFALSPRNQTLEDVKYAGQEELGEGDYRYVIPNEPKMGILFKAEGAEDWGLINSPYLTDEDVYRVLMQEAPSVAGDIVVGGYAAAKWAGPAGRAVGITGNIAKQGLKIVGMSGAAAVGAAGGEFIRLALGNAMGAHDRDFGEVLEESAMMGAFAFAGTAAISTASHVLPNLWRKITGKDVTPEYLARIEDAWTAANDPNSISSPGVIYGKSESVAQINKQLEDLAERFAADLGEDGFQSLIAGAARTTDATDLEIMFLRHATDPTVHAAYKKIREGNRVVIDKLVRLLQEKIGPDITGVDAPLSIELSEGLRTLVQRDIDNFGVYMEEVINKVRTEVGGQGADAAVAGNIARKVPDEELSGAFFPRWQRRIREIINADLEVANKNFNTAITSPRYANTATGSGQTRPATDAWLNARGGSADALLGSAEADEAVALLMQQRLGGSNQTLRRLQGLAREGNIDPKTGKSGVTGGRFESPDFSLAELNSMRVSLNEFRNETTNTVARKHARDLMSGIEEQMHTLVRKSASEKSGIPLTPAREAELNQWIRDKQWGDDIKAAWTAQKEVYELRNSQAIKSLLQQDRPEAVAKYLFDTSVPGTGVNTPVADLMTLLRNEGSDDVLSLQEGLAAYIQREVLDARSGGTGPDLAPLQIARKYRNFVKQHEGVLKAVFGEEEYAQRFNVGGPANRGPGTFQREVIEKLEGTEEAITLLKNRFGIGVTDPANEITNIVEAILDTGKTQKYSGRVLRDIRYLTDLVEDQPELQEQIAQVTKRYIFQNIIDPAQGGGWMLNEDVLFDFLNKGFGPPDLVGDRLTFENFITPLLGKDGPEFVKNLRFLEEILHAHLGRAPSEDIVGRFAPKYTTVPQGAKFLQRMVIAPLTQMGRRVTAITNNTTDRAHKFMGQMLMDQDLFNRTIAAARGRVSMQNFTRYLVAHQSVAAQDIGNELKYYDTEDKVQRTPSSEGQASFGEEGYASGFFDRLMGVGAEVTGRSLNYPNRLLDLWYGEPD